MTLFDEIKRAKVPYDNHESDLYFQWTPESMAILNKYPRDKKNSTKFRCASGHPDVGQVWVDVPFAYPGE